MSKPIACFCVFFYFSSPMLFAQSLCDTLKINNVLTQAQAFLTQGKIQQAIEASLSALSGLDACPGDTTLREKVSVQVARCYQSAASDFLQRGKFNQSIDASERSIALLLQMPEKHVDALATAYLDLAKAHGLDENRKIAIEIALKGLEIRRSANPFDPKLVAHYANLVDHYLVLLDTVNTWRYLQEWDKLNRRVGSKTSLQTRVNFTNSLALYYYQTGQIPKGIQVLEDTLARYGEQLRAKGGLIGTSEYTLCEFYAAERNYEKSLYYAEKNVALFESRIKQQKGKLFSRAHYTWCLAQASKAAWGLYIQTGDTSWYRLAERRCLQAEDMYFAIRDRSATDGFREWMNDRTDIVGNLVEVRQGLYAQTGNRMHTERAFEALEASKTMAVQQFLHETYALLWGGLPDSVYQQEIRYRQEVNELETNFFMMRMRPNGDSLIAANDQNLFALRDRYSIFLADLEKNYPEYFRLKYSHQAISLSEAQDQIVGPGQCLLDLYIKNNKVFALLIRPDTVVWLATPFDSAAQKALRTLESESNHFAEYQHLPEKDYLKHLQIFADASYRVYQVLLQPLRGMLTEEVLLVPRNDLGSLPFGTLLTQQETNMAKPFLWHFLDKELTLSQTFSVGMFQFVQNRRASKKTSGTLLALAPFFEGNISEDIQLPDANFDASTRSDLFKPLPGSGDEAQSIARLTNGESLIGTYATKTSFLKKCPDFRILHFATHSAANNVLGEYSYVALQKENEPQKIDMLYARDIYSLRLSADLVVLSACETALGQYRWGEGMIGLTRAFTCAGARNVVASLWTVDDASTKDLMILFYKEIEKGEPYNRALANAKRSFILKNRQYAHPYYWAGFVLNGR